MPRPHRFRADTFGCPLLLTYGDFLHASSVAESVCPTKLATWRLVSGLVSVRAGEGTKYGDAGSAIVALAPSGTLRLVQGKDMARRTIVLAAAALAAGVGVAWLMLANEVREAGGLDVTLVLVVGWSFVAAGLVAWRLRPENRIGPAMVLTGFLRFAAVLFWSQGTVVEAEIPCG